MQPFIIKDNTLVLSVKLTPNAKLKSINGVGHNENYGHFLKISVTTIPEKGKANKDLINFLAKELKIAKSNFEIISGITDRYKKIKITGNIEEIKAKIIKVF